MLEFWFNGGLVQSRMSIARWETPRSQPAPSTILERQFMAGLIIVGGGELARVIIEAASASGANILGFVDPLPCEETTLRLGIQRLGSDDALSSYPEAALILGVGSIKASAVRARVVESILPGRWATVIHPSAQISPTSHISEGAVVLAGAVVCTGAQIGRHAIINLGAMIDHDVFVGDFVHVAPKAALGGGSKVCHGAYIGMGACVRDHTIVNANTTVGMGATVTREFAASSTLIGTPARPMIAEEARAT